MDEDKRAAFLAALTVLARRSDDLTVTARRRAWSAACTP